jgi:hypothetical protein
VATLANPARPGDADLAPRRWLAQLAVNIVDFLDEDDISTPFQFYTSQDAGDPQFDAGPVRSGNPELPRYWVFGTELPRVVLNEVLAEYQLPLNPVPGRVDVKVWAELFNPLPAGSSPLEVQPLDGLPVPLYMPGAGGAPGYAPYQVVIANTNTHPGGPLLPRSGDNDNVLGTPDVARSATADADFANLVSTVGDPTIHVPAQLAPQSFFLLGPPDSDARATIAPPLVPAGTPFLRSPDLTVSVRYRPPDTFSPNDRRSGITVLLRRSTNPYLPPGPTAGAWRRPESRLQPVPNDRLLAGHPPRQCDEPRRGLFVLGQAPAVRGRPQPGSRADARCRARHPAHTGPAELPDTRERPLRLAITSA